LQINIREKVMPDIQRVNNYLMIFISSMFLKAWGSKSNISHKGFLITSYSGFAFCILIGIAIVIVAYILKSRDIVAKDKGKDLVAEKDADEKRKCLKEFSDLVRGNGKIEKVLSVLLFFQPLIFSISIVSLVIFLIWNT